MSTQNEKLWAYAKYLYDAMGHRIRLFEIGKYNNQSFTIDVLLLYREGVMYEINDKAKTCQKKPLKVDFQPLKIPDEASFIGQFVIGSSSGPGEGLLVNSWQGDIPNEGKYFATVTEFGCIPVSVVYQTKQFGWAVTSYLDNLIGIIDPNLLNPPSFCPALEAEVDSGEEPVDFLNVFFTKP